MFHNKIVLGKFYKGVGVVVIMGNRRGLEMVVTTVIMIVLSIAVLTVLVVFLNSQTGFLSKWFRTQTTESNVDVVVSACDNLVTTEAVYAYCCEKKEVRFGGDRGIEKLTCSKVALADWSAGKVREMSCPENICGE